MRDSDLPWVPQHAARLTCAAETANHAFLLKLVATLRPLRELSAQQEAMLATPPSSEAWLAFKLRATHNGAIASSTALAGQVSALSHELSVRRLSARDLKSLFRLVRSLAARSSGFVAFHEMLSSVRRPGPDSS